jgi:hypothetical protein
VTKDRQNLTVQLDTRTIRKARVLAAERGTSVSKLVAEQIERMVLEDQEYEEARRRALALLDTGFHLGGGPLPRRDELYDR